MRGTSCGACSWRKRCGRRKKRTSDMRPRTTRLPNSLHMNGPSEEETSRTRHDFPSILARRCLNRFASKHFPVANVRLNMLPKNFPDRKIGDYFSFFLKHSRNAKHTAAALVVLPQTETFETFRDGRNWNVSKSRNQT